MGGPQCDVPTPTQGIAPRIPISVVGVKRVVLVTIQRDSARGTRYIAAARSGIVRKLCESVRARRRALL